MQPIRQQSLSLTANGAKEIRKQAVPGRLDSGIVFDER
jgi:hypothetical protein